jgi:hypothetical protein
MSNSGVKRLKKNLLQIIQQQAQSTEKLKKQAITKKMSNSSNPD